MKNKLFAALLAAAFMCGTAAYAQEAEPKTGKKERKAVKKEMKGKHHKAVKKAVKSEKKDDMGK